MGTGPIRGFIILLPEGNSDDTVKENPPTTARTQPATSGTGSDPVSSQMTASNTNEKTLVMDLKSAQEPGYLKECSKYAHLP